MIWYTRDLHELYHYESKLIKVLARHPAITCSINRSIRSFVFISFPSGQKDHSFYRTLRSGVFEEYIKGLNYSNHSKKQKWEF